MKNKNKKSTPASAAKPESPSKDESLNKKIAECAALDILLSGDETLAGIQVLIDEKHAETLKQECIEREIALQGDETLAELKALIDKEDEQIIAGQELANLRDQCNAKEIEFSAEENKEELQAKLDAWVAPEGEEPPVELTADQKRMEHKVKVLVAIQSTEITPEMLQDNADVLVAMCKKMEDQCNRDKKSPERFYRAARELNNMKNNVFVR